MTKGLWLLEDCPYILEKYAEWLKVKSHDGQTDFQMVKQKSIHTCREGDTKQMWVNPHVGDKYMGIPYTILLTFLFVWTVF